jgi:hypothetical protein
MVGSNWVGGGGNQVQTPDIEQKLLDLINDLDRFRQDKWFSQELNIFKAIGLYRQEIRHSNFLAFLLSPQQNHGLKDGFLKRLIQKALDKFTGEPLITPLKIALADFSDAIASREWRNIDVLVESETNRFIFAIENKIDSIEGQRQLETYERVVCAEYPSHVWLFSYLTPDGSPASRDTWSAISYSDVIEALTETVDRSSELTAPARMAIGHYVDLIRRNIVPDQALIDQCRRLYSLHKDALDLIIEYGQVNSFVAAANSFFDKHPELEKFQIRPSQAAFLSKSFLERIPPIQGTNWWGQSRPLALFFNLCNGRFGILLEFGPI